MTTVRINQTEDNRCRDGEGEVWTVFKMSDKNPLTPICWRLLFLSHSGGSVGTFA